MSLYNVIKRAQDGSKRVVAVGLDLKAAEALSGTMNRLMKRKFNSFGYRDDFTEFDFVKDK